MSSELQVRVPDIGDFTDVPVIEIHVSPGDSVGTEDPLVTLESDKATMDVPAPSAGVVKQLGVKLGDRVSEGSLLLVLEGEQSAATERARLERRPAGTSTEPSPAPASTGTGPIHRRIGRLRRRRSSCSGRDRAATRPRSGPPTSV